MSMTSMSGSNNVVVIGGGAAGMMAAGTAASFGAHVTLLEPNGKLGKKLFITGKGRCNVTNNCTSDEVLKNVPVNPRFLYSALSGFSPADAMAFFEGLGCPLKTERGNRVFPESDQAGSVIDALRRFLKETGVKIEWERALEILTENGAVTGVRTQTRVVPADKVILATGGCSYPATGSTGDGYEMARRLGHTIIEPRGSLVPLVEKGHTCAAMQGLAVVPLFAGYDLAPADPARAGRIFSFDVAGGLYEETGYDSIGSGSLFAKSALKKRYRPGVGTQDAVRLAVEALYDAADDDTATGGPDTTRKIYPVVMTATADSTHRLTEAEITTVAERVVSRRMENPGG